MLKLCFENCEALLPGVEHLREDLGIALTPKEEADALITAEESEKAGFGIESHVSASGKPEVKITYGGGKVRFFRALSIACEALKNGKTAFTAEQAPLFDTNGAMFDMSRNAVMTVNTVKYAMRKMALMGLNTFMLYTEDTYEVPERPYFGYMRGRYTKDEIREMDAYALSLGIELVPCIQTLGHLATYLRWAAADEYKDSPNTLLSGAEATYRFVDDLFRNVAECFTSRRLHMGMDETHDLGTGRALDLYGYRERKDLYFEHLKKVVEIAQKYGFKPMMWSDMFFRLSAAGMENYEDYDMRTKLLPNIGELLPAGVVPVFWDYYHPNEDFYAENLEKHKMLSDQVLFAGGVWAWSGYAVQFSRSITNSVPALEACRKKGTREVIATIWHNGSEASELMALAGLAMYAEFDYQGRYDVDDIRACTLRVLGAPYDDFLATEAVEYPHLDNTATGASRALIYNDPLCGLVDRHIAVLDAGEYYRSLTPRLSPLAEGKGELAPAFEVLARFSSLMENKADFGVRLKKAYDAGDREALASLQAECGIIREKLEALREAHRASWMRWNKPFGWEIHDIRYGGLLMRFDTAARRLEDYLAGRIEKIEELDEERLRMNLTSDEDTAFNGNFLWFGYTAYATANILP